MNLQENTMYDVMSECTKAGVFDLFRMSIPNVKEPGFDTRPFDMMHSVLDLITDTRMGELNRIDAKASSVGGGNGTIRNFQLNGDLVTGEIVYSNTDNSKDEFNARIVVTLYKSIEINGDVVMHVTISVIIRPDLEVFIKNDIIDSIEDEYTVYKTRTRVRLDNKDSLSILENFNGSVSSVETYTTPTALNTNKVAYEHSRDSVKSFKYAMYSTNAEYSIHIGPEYALEEIRRDRQECDMYLEGSRVALKEHTDYTGDVRRDRDEQRYMADRDISRIGRDHLERDRGIDRIGRDHLERERFSERREDRKPLLDLSKLSLSESTLLSINNNLEKLVAALVKEDKPTKDELVSGYFASNNEGTEAE